jgi:hypothetical protein
MLLIDGIKYNLFIPANETALEQFVENNYKHIFGQDSIYLPKKKIKSKAGIGVIPDAFVIYFDPKPVWCVLEVELSSHPLYEHIFPQLTKFKRAVEDNMSKKSLTRFFYESIIEDPLLEAGFKQKIGSGEIYKSISDMIEEKKPLFVVVIDKNTDELEEVILDYNDNVRVIEFKTYQREGAEGVVAFSFQSLVTPSPQRNILSSTQSLEKGEYKRGQLGKAIYSLFDNKGIENVSYEECEKLALTVKPDSKFNTYHFSWYKNHYRKAGDKNKPKSFEYTVMGKTFTVYNARQVLTGILEALSEYDNTFMERFCSPDQSHGTKRRYVALNRKDLYPERPDLCESSACQLKNGFWVGTNYNTSSIKQIIRLATEVAGLKYGKDVIDSL